MTLHILIEGFVQGVGFRQYIKHKANRLNVKGWVKNLPDGRVEVVLSGNQENVREMIDYCNKGPFLSDVKNVKTTKIEKRTFSSFDIIRE